MLPSALQPTWIPVAKKVKAVKSDQDVAVSESVYMYRDGGIPPVYFFPTADVNHDLLTRSDIELPSELGTYINYSMVVDGELIEGAAWEFVEPSDPVEFLSGYVAVRWDAMDSWIEEDEEVFVHPRDPFKRIDMVNSYRPVEVIIGSESIAMAPNNILLLEPGLPARYYLPQEAVKDGVLQPSETTSQCPYKGDASYFSAAVGDTTVEDVAWTYAKPHDEATKIQGLICFFEERVDKLIVDGKTMPKPETPWGPEGGSFARPMTPWGPPGAADLGKGPDRD